MSVADDVCAIAAEARLPIKQWLKAAETIAGLREAATEKELNWSALKAVIVASIKDEEDNGDRVEQLAKKADHALAYADALRNKFNSTDPAPHKSPPSALSVAAGNVISLEGGRPGHSPMRAGGDDNAPSKEATSEPAAPRRPIPPARHDPLVPSAPGTSPQSQSVASDSSLTSPSGAGEAATTSALAVASSFLCTVCGAEREEAETLCWSCRAADLPEYRVSDSELLATPSVARDRPLNRKDDGDAATKGSAVAASANSSAAMGAGPTNDDDQFNRIPAVLDRNRVTA